MPKLNKTTLDRLNPGPTPYQVMDDRMPNFGVRVLPSGRKTFFVRYRVDGASRRHKLGVYGEAFTAHQARAEAVRVLAAVSAGDDPSAQRRERRNGLTMEGLAEEYLENHARPHKAPSSVRMDEINLRAHVLPRLGRRLVSQVSTEDVLNLHKGIGKTSKGAANRVLALLSKMFNLAERWGFRPPGSNPARHIPRYREQRKERYLSDEEYRALFAGINDLAARFPEAMDAVTLLAYTGLRCGEVLGLRWAHYDDARGQLHLVKTKTGTRRVSLNDAARGLLDDRPNRKERPEAWVFRHRSFDGRPLSYNSLRWSFAALREEVGLDREVTLHTLRHSFASLGVRTGLTLPQIGALLGHRTPATTQRYAHLTDDPLQAVSQRVGSAMPRRPRPEER